MYLADPTMCSVSHPFPYWKVHHLTGVAVTPVVCYVGEIGHIELCPNPDEVAECFTVPLAHILDRDRYVIAALM